TLTPAVTVAVGETTLVEGTDYDIVKYTSNVNAGTGTVTIAGKGDYVGTASQTFIINPTEATDENGENDADTDEDTEDVQATTTYIDEEEEMFREHDEQNVTTATTTTTQASDE
ncbi:MAG: hypothetical protein IKI94_08670, partial [Ruminococcus sp.]|nr:hypothetical protein [Ruminococcus sp.]